MTGTNTATAFFPDQLISDYCYFTRFDTNYGNAGWLDNINGTAFLFNKSKQFPLHQIFHGWRNPGSVEELGEKKQ